MYGLIIENVLGYLRSHFHPKRYQEIKNLAKFPYEEVEIDKVYPDGHIPKLVKKASQVLQITEQEILEGVGVYFVTITKHLGLRSTITSIAREFREFIMNLDNAHDYFKLRFTKMRPPSFFVDEEHEHGLTLSYRSRRRGFSYYVLGQMKEIAKVIFKKDLEITLKKQEVQFDTVIVKFDLNFDNSAFVAYQRSLALRQEASLPVRAHVLFEIFPFSILFTEQLQITLVGTSLRLIMPGIVGHQINECFILVRPLVEFNAEQILQRTNNVWFLKAMPNVCKVKKVREIELKMAQKKKLAPPISGEENDDLEDDSDALVIRGTMTFMSVWKKILFIGCPVIKDLHCLVANGLFINDLSMHDYSRDIMITNSQHVMEERMTRKLIEDKTASLEDINEKYQIISQSNYKTLRSWIPTQFALLAGADQDFRKEPLAKSLDFCAIVYAEVDRILTFASKADPIDIIDLLDDVLRVFEHLTETLGLLKVETASDYLAVADFTAGLNEDTQVERAATLALDLDDAARCAFREPLTRGRVLKFRIVVHTGPVIAAVIGGRLPKFCLFGPLLRDALALVEYCQPGKIIMHESLKPLLPSSFRYVPVLHPPSECVYITDRLDHTPISVIPILHAYAAFKANRNKNHKNRQMSQESSEKSKDVEIVSSNGNFVCNGFTNGVRGSTTCSVL